MRLVIISLDAVFAQDQDQLLSLPNLGKLAREGVFCDNVQTIYPSLTYPIHASLMTGCYPDVHGIAHNEPFQPQKDPSQRAWYWDERHIKTDTLFSQAKKAGRECASILWPTTGHSRNIKFNLPEIIALPGENQVLKVLSFGSTWWLIKSELRYGKQRVSTKQPHLDDFSALMARKVIERQYVPLKKEGSREVRLASLRKQQQHMPDLLAVHFTDTDTMRHTYGTFSDEISASLTRLDERVGSILDTLERHKVLKDSIVAVVSDHGHADVTGSLPLDGWLQANHIPARAQSLGLGAYLHLRRADYLPVLQALQDNQELLQIAHIYTREELRMMHAPEDVLLAVEPVEGLVYVDEGEEARHLATHGFGPHHPAAKTLLWLSGPPFAKGLRLPGCDIVDIAPTLAQAAGLTLPRAQGRVLEEAFLWSQEQQRRKGE
ncbi:MAG: alkaline phosphatase family protein [Clostridiales bacterium]|nr:alkaline phosphatase family protein [Clostridiales bacterium]